MRCVSLVSFFSKILFNTCIQNSRTILRSRRRYLGSRKRNGSSDRWSLH
jgi:hypothetical protein